MPTIAEARTPALLFGSLVVIALLLTERRSLREELSSARTALQQDEQAQEPQLQTNDSGNRRLQRVDTATWTLEDLAFYYGTDKSHDDHKYVDVYESIFGPLRFSTVNFTEIGVAMGQSLQMWHDYFPNAHVWGVDIHPLVIKAAKKLFAQQPRVHILAANSKSNVKVPALGLAPESMDIVIDDGDHFPPAMERTLLAWWRYVKPGGFYLIEDIATGANMNGQRYGHARGAKRKPGYPPGFSPLIHNVSFLLPEVLDILQGADAYFSDTLIGHRAYDALRVSARCCMRDRVDHNSHVLVLRKRIVPRQRLVQSNTRDGAAMKGAGVKPMLTPAQLRGDPSRVLGALSK